MRNRTELTLSSIGLLAAATAFYACSADPEGGPPGGVNTFSGNDNGNGNNGTPSNGGSDNANSNGNGGTDATGNPTNINEGNPDPNLNVGAGGSANTGGGAAGSMGMAGALMPGEIIEDVPPQETPGGYFESGAWHGYAWTGDDELGLGTTRSVLNFDELPEGEPFCLEGSVGPDPESSPGAGDGYEGVALLGFNVAQEAFGVTEGAEPAIGTAVPTGIGVAVNYTKTAGQLLRIQLQGPNGETLNSERWCADLTAVQGPAFVPYSAFRTNCWEDPPTAASVAYNMSPVAAVVMTIPGSNEDPVPYNVCISGFADGNSVADAPDSISLPAGLLTGTISNEAGKFKVIGRDGHEYVVNNNAWGVNSNNTTQALRYTANSFEILRQTAGPGGDSSPASFPSIYIGANGAQSGVNGATTAGDNPLPIQVSAINSLPTTFRHSGPLGDNNATYDVWFAPSPPNGEYDTALAAFLMVWTHIPNGRFAIGNNVGNFDIEGANFNLFVGPRGGGGPDSNLPVISYVATQTIRNYSFNLDAFIEHAVGRNVGLTNGMFLTDVFAGFEIWSGGAGLRVDEFSAVINP